MTSPDWSPLRTALRDCRAHGVPVPFWWRDDDATRPTAALDRLATLSADVELPVHLAIIPAGLDPKLALHIDTDRLIPVVHGWAHADHSGPTDKKNEFLTPRAGALDDAARGLQQLSAVFGPDLRPMFVPPWNRISPLVAMGLTACGYTALSTFGPRVGAFSAPGLTQINTHIDPIWWKGTRDLVDPEALIEQTVSYVRGRADDSVAVDDPLGLLTHHLVHTEAIWGFVHRFLNEMLDGGATPWQQERQE